MTDEKSITLEEIERKNQELADLLFGMLESVRNEQIYSLNLSQSS